MRPRWRDVLSVDDSDHESSKTSQLSSPFFIVVAEGLYCGSGDTRGWSGCVNQAKGVGILTGVYSIPYYGIIIVSGWLSRRSGAGV
jgi:hypothetical protein